MSHIHHDHRHAHSTQHALSLALVFNGLLLIIEAIVGWATNSLALLSDAAHMLSDVFALSIALAASILASRPATPNRSFGFSGAEVLGAFINAFGLLIACFVIFKEAFERLAYGIPEIMGMPVLIVGAIGLLINIGSAWYLSKGDHDNLNIRGALIHMIADALGSVGAIIAAIFMLYGVSIADPIISLFLALIILWTSYGLFKDCIGVMLGFSPKTLDAIVISNALLGLEEVSGIHDLHVWSVDGKHALLTGHIVVGESFNPNGELLNKVQLLLSEQFGIKHSTIQFECNDSNPCGQENCT